jgi:hypothetical protein
MASRATGRGAGRPGPPRPATAAETGDHDAGLLALAAVPASFYDQLDANGEGGARVRLALTLAPVHVTGTIGPPCYWAISNGMRPAER